MPAHPKSLSRYADDGTKPKLIDNDVLGKNQIRVQEIGLNILHPEALKKFAEIQLEGKVSEELNEVLMRSTNGNPF